MDVFKWIFALILSGATFIVTPESLADQQGEWGKCRQLTSGLVVFNNDARMSIKGFTDLGIKEIIKLAKDFQHTEKAFNSVIEGQEDIFNAHMMAWGLGQNHLLLGGPGAAKTMGVDFLFPNLWGRQVAEWTMPEDIFGGKTEEATKKGIDDINDVGMALRAEAVLLDEINNMNPGLGSDLMSYLNAGERFVRIAGNRRYAETRTVFSTGNATLVEILYNFKERQLQSGPAILSRFGFKSILSNWRHQAQQKRLNVFYQWKDQLKFQLLHGNPIEQANARVLLNSVEPRQINYHMLDFISRALFKPDREFDAALRQLNGKLREQLNMESLDSKIEANSEIDGVFEPGSDFNERHRAIAWKAVRMSATLDFLRLPEEIQRRILNDGPITLSPFSIWRVVQWAKPSVDGMSFYNFPKMRMEFNLVRENNQGDYRPFSIGRMQETSRNKREQDQWGYIETEQRIFNDTLNAELEGVKQSAEEIAAIVDLDPAEIQSTGSLFEKIIFNTLYKDIADSLE